jgi:nicotinamide riboside kinase
VVGAESSGTTTLARALAIDTVLDKSWVFADPAAL